MIQIVVAIHASSAGIEGLHRYETQVLPILAEHGGKLLTAFTPEGHESPDCPDEIHLLEFPSREAFRQYREDARIKSLSGLRAESIAKTTLYISQQIHDYGLSGDRSENLL